MTREEVTIQALRNHIEVLEENIRALEQEPRKGHWIKIYVDEFVMFQCDCCGRKIMLWNKEKLSDFPYCHCGAEMESEE